MPRFVILQHEMPSERDRPTHWDFMLEAGDVLWTWALPRPPEVGQAMEVERLADHRTAYLDYEGTVSGGRGRVMRWDAGTYETQRPGDNELVLLVRGGRLSGRVRLTKDASEPHRWRFDVEPAT